MRSQTTKPVPKKGAQNKTTLKSSPLSKQIKKKASTPKKVQNVLKKSLAKPCKKNVTKDAVTENKPDADSVSGEKLESLQEQSEKAGPSKFTGARSVSPTKKIKNETKERKSNSKNSCEAIQKKNSKKSTASKSDKKTKSLKASGKIEELDSDDVKYKLNSDVIKTLKAKFSKSKTIVKKSSILAKKFLTPNKTDKIGKETTKIETLNIPIRCDEKQKIAVLVETSESGTENVIKAEENKKDGKSETKSNNLVSPISNSTNSIVDIPPKAENERPPKFFTSNRSPRTVDIDVKYGKTAKGNLSMSERFLSMKCVESKPEDSCKEKINLCSNFISQDAEVDVYTFTDKVDSPKSILSGFRSPLNKNVGRVRPIARVKGTIIDKAKSDTEKKKYSPHRPIEEVVKQLKANKKTEEIQSTYEHNSETTSSGDVDTDFVLDTKEDDDKPKPIISKSYKMVARKTSIPGQPFSPIKIIDEEALPVTKTTKNVKCVSSTKKCTITKSKKKLQKVCISDEELEACKFSLNTKSKNTHYSSSDESVSESNDDNDTKESSESDVPKNKKLKSKKYKRITDSIKKQTSKELKELSKDSLIDLKEDSVLLNKEKPSKRRLKLLSMWTGPKKHRMASLNALAKVHCLYENESRSHMELGLMKTVDRQIAANIPSKSGSKKKDTKMKTDSEKRDSTSESEYERRDKSHLESSEEDSPSPSTRTLRGVPGIRSTGKYWDPKSSTSSSEDSEIDYKKQISNTDKKKTPTKSVPIKSDSDKPPAKMKKTSGVAVKKKRNRNEVVMDLKDMVVQKRMASLNATAILAASYEKRSPKSSKDDSTSDSCSDESFIQRPKNGAGSGVKSETKNEDTKKESDEIDGGDRKQKVEVIVNQDTDVTITGVYSTHHHEGFCTVAGMQYRISSTSHTQTTATANCEKEGCSREEGTARYTPLSALSSMQPPADQAQSPPHPVPELGGLARRAAGCSSAFSAPSPSAHHDPGYYQPAGPLIKDGGPDAERALARYHPAPHYHAPHPQVLQQYGGPYYPAELCYGRYYRPPGPYHMPPPQADAQMVGVGGEPYPPPQYYGGPPCYQHSPQRVPYIEYRCPCPMNAFPKNVLIGPATGKAPTGGGPDAASALVGPPGGAFRPKVRAARVLDHADSHGSGKDPPREPEPPAAADAPRPCPMPAAIGGASPKREMYDVRDNLRLAGDTPGPAEAVGPPSPARGSDGVYAPQPPPLAPRRARLGKAMARRSLAGDDTALLLTAPQPPAAAHSDAEDDVLAISPPAPVPIDLSSSDETERRSTPLIDVKKENEGPIYPSPRKTDALALREHNSATVGSDPEIGEGAKPVKRRYSKPKLEIELCDIDLNDGCRTNGIGEHVKLQKRRKVATEQSDLITRPEIASASDGKKKISTKQKSVPKTTQSAPKRSLKRKSDSIVDETSSKKANTDTSVCQEEPRCQKISVLPDELKTNVTKPKNKSALLLDNLIRKNSIDRPDAKSFDSDAPLNPAELFLSPKENETSICGKKSLTINNNIVEDSVLPNAVRLNTIAAVTQHINKKLATANMTYKTEKADKVETKVTVHNLHPTKPVLNSPVKNKLYLKEEGSLAPNKLNTKSNIKSLLKLCSKVSKIEKDNSKTKETLCEEENIDKSQMKVLGENNINSALDSSLITTTITLSEKPSAKLSKHKLGLNKTECNHVAGQTASEKSAVQIACNKVKGTDLNKIEKDTIEKIASKMKSASDKLKSHKPKLSSSILKTDSSIGEVKEKVVKLLVSKRPAIKSDEAAAVVEEACASPIARMPGRRARRRRSSTRRLRRPAPLLALPDADEKRAPPRWSNGWTWDGEPYLSKVYLNNDARLDRTARCWSRMTHQSGDCVARGDCVLLRASSARAQPFVARVARLWENPEDGEMMVSLVWYYRPEHTERGRQPDDALDEVFASRHRDANSVACIEDKCYVLTFNEYCRYRKRLKAAEEGITVPPSLVPPMPSAEITPAVATNDMKLSPSVSPELVLFCRKIYDFRSKKIQVPNK